MVWVMPVRIPGPGLGMEESTRHLVLDMIVDPALSLPMVLDADGLNHLAGEEAAPRLPDSAILTPHPGEAAKLLGLDSAARVQEDRVTALARLVEKFEAVVLLKGTDTHVGAPSLPPLGQGAVGGDEVNQNRVAKRCERL